jgi:hypothetical protein
MSLGRKHDSSSPPQRTRTHSQTSSSPLTPPPPQFELKRLLAKPAPPNARSHGNGTEADGATLPEHRKERSSRSDSRPRLDIHINSGAPLDLDLHSFGQDSSLPSRSDPPPLPTKRTRNVLRRRPSATTPSKSPGISGNASISSPPTTHTTTITSSPRRGFDDTPRDIDVKPTHSHSMFFLSAHSSCS